MHGHSTLNGQSVAVSNPDKLKVELHAARPSAILPASSRNHSPNSPASNSNMRTSAREPLLFFSVKLCNVAC
jgi:hypothetical protein